MCIKYWYSFLHKSQDMHNHSYEKYSIVEHVIKHDAFDQKRWHTLGDSWSDVYKRAPATFSGQITFWKVLFWNNQHKHQTELNFCLCVYIDAVVFVCILMLLVYLIKIICLFYFPLHHCSQFFFVVAQTAAFSQFQWQLKAQWDTANRNAVQIAYCCM